MKKLILIALLITGSLLSGCSIVSPFKPINSCTSFKNNGANCANVESNLEYSIANGSNIPQEEIQSKKQSKKDKKNIDNSTETNPTVHSDRVVEKSELIRLITVMNIEAGLSQEPVLIPPASYKVVILPYSDGKRFYSGRNLYIVAGKPRWVAGNFLMSGDKYKLGIETPKEKETQTNVTVIPVPTPVQNNTSENPANNQSNKASEVINPSANEASRNSYVKVTDITPIFKHKVSAYLLNCRDMPSFEGNAIAVFEQDTVLNIIDKHSKWWEVSYHDVKCYVNSTYLYNEQEQ